ncbi:hypothetical protein O181_022949, partial [Austropuccinia psidii MF-1]|nr:hypothetical protein [Austropuccinia psidii MF-1]
KPYTSPSALLQSVLCGSGILSKLASPWLMASASDFDPGQTYDGYKEVEVLEPACTECLAKGKDCFQNFNPKSSKCHFCFVGKKPCCCSGPLASNIKRVLWSKTDGPFGKEFPVSEAPTPNGNSGYSNFEAVHNSIGHQSSTSPSHPPMKRFQGHIIHRPPRTLQPALDTLPASPSYSTTRPAFIPAVRQSPIPQSRNSPIVTSQELQPVASSSRRREELSHFLFPAAQVFQRRECWPIQATREDPNTASKNQDAVARLLRRVDRNSRELIKYANNRTASEEMAEKSSWYEYELINDF